jgi:uncharacterized membrane protein
MTRHPASVGHSLSALALLIWAGDRISAIPRRTTTVGIAA